LFTGPQETLRGLKNYVGSLALSADGALIATSSPVGGKVVFWDTATGNWVGELDVFDGCGVAPTPDKGFIVSSGQGILVRSQEIDDNLQILAPSSDLAWDNHMRRI
jgi:hypothetical protein